MEENSRPQEEQPVENLVTPEAKIAELEQKLSESNEKILRALAEVENVRRRSREEIDKAGASAFIEKIGFTCTTCEGRFKSRFCWMIFWFVIGMIAYLALVFGLVFSLTS